MLLRTARPFSAIVALVLLGACGNDNMSHGPVFVWPSASSGDEMTALIKGELYVDATGCVGLITATGKFPVVWPHGTTFDPTARSIALASGRNLQPGVIISGGGGYIGIDGLSRVVGADLSIPASCLPSTREVAVFNPQAGIDIVRSP